MVRPIEIKFVVCLETKNQCISHRSWLGYIFTCAREHVQMCPLFASPGMAERTGLRFGVWLDIEVLDRRFIKVRSIVHLLVRTYVPLFLISIRLDALP